MNRSPPEPGGAIVLYTASSNLLQNQ